MFSSTRANAQDAAFSSAGLAPTPEAHALSGARGQTGGDAASSVTNPGALALAPEARFACSHLRWADGLSREWLAVSGRKEQFAFGLDAGLLHSPALPGYDESGQATGTFSASEWSLGLTVARQFGASSVGLGGRMHQLSESSTSLNGIGFAIGATHEHAGWTAGASLRDLGMLSGVKASEYRLPTRVSVGAERAFGRGSVLALSCERAHGETCVRFGTVIAPLPSFELMGGSAMRTGTADFSLEWGGGLRVRLSRFSASYAYHAAGDLGATHQVGIELPLTHESSFWEGIPDASPAREAQ